MKYFVLAEDMAAAVVGPFDDSCEAEAHIAFCLARNDGARMDVASEALADDWAIRHVALRMTAEKDRLFKYSGGNDK